MSHPAAVIGLTYDDVDLQAADGTLLCQITAGLDEVPSVRGDDVVIPHRQGRSQRNRVIDTLPIVLDCQVTGDPTESDPEARAASYRFKLRAARVLFTPDRLRAPLVATLEDGSSLTIQARPVNIVPGREVPREYRQLNVELVGDGDWEVVGS